MTILAPSVVGLVSVLSLKLGVPAWSRPVTCPGIPVVVKFLVQK